MYYAAVFRGKDILGVQIENIGAASACPCILPERPPPCKVPYRGRFRSDNHAAVLRLQRTQPKDRRAYDAPYRNPYRAAARTGRADHTERAAGRARGADSTGRREPRRQMKGVKYEYDCRQ